MEDSGTGLRIHLTSFPSEAWDQISSRKSRVQQKLGGRKCMFDRQGVPTRIKPGSGEDQEFCLLAAFLVG